ncbi:hypothetical protein BGZ83_008475 [Gryganskiella cystojenkinii]|nr:hypothetical protein BGZ83_008475 [Gryganskiella cystojenkinii]
MTSISPKDPMLLPEIVHHVCKFLPHSNFFKCVIVCKLWHTTFLPELYREINAVYLRKIDISDLALVRCGHHLKQLAIELDNVLLVPLSMSCRHLQNLVLVVDKHTPEHRATLLWLLNRNPGIHTIKLEGAENYKIEDGPPNLLLDVLEHAPSVTDLSITYMEMGPEDVQGLMFLRSNHLTRLYLRSCYLEHARRIWNEVRVDGNSDKGLLGRRPYFPRLRNLILDWYGTDMTSAQQVQWLGQCPALGRLFWRIQDDNQYHDPETGLDVDYNVETSKALEKMYRSVSNHVPEFVSSSSDVVPFAVTVSSTSATNDNAKVNSLVPESAREPPFQEQQPQQQQHFCPQSLTSVEIIGFSVSDHSQSLMLQLNPALFRKLVISSSEFGMKSMMQLKRHFATLEILALPSSATACPWSCQVILSSCPRLKHFTAGDLDLYAENPFSSLPQPWVCQSLEVLHIGKVLIQDKEGEDSAQRQKRSKRMRIEVLNRLSQLKGLQDLSLSVTSDWCALDISDDVMDGGSDQDTEDHEEVMIILSSEFEKDPIPRLLQVGHWDPRGGSYQLRWVPEIWPKLQRLSCYDAEKCRY